MMEAVKKRLAEIRERAEKATPGPWVHSYFGTQVLTGDNWNSVCRMHTCGNLPNCNNAHWEDGRGPKGEDSNAHFIAASRTDIPALLDLVEALLEKVQRDIKRCRSHRSWDVELWDAENQGNSRAAHDQACNECREALAAIARFGGEDAK